MTDTDAKDIVVPDALIVNGSPNVVIIIDSDKIARNIIVDGFSMPLVAAARVPIEAGQPLQIHFEIYVRRIVTMTRESYEAAKAAGAEK
jgi:hypothetical protein